MRGFTLRGHLSAQLIRQHTECLHGVTVRVYRAFSEIVDAHVLPLKNEFRCLAPKEAKSKEKLLLGAAKADRNGRYSINLIDNYDGGTIEIDIKVDNVPFQKRKSKIGPQINLRKFSPIWRQREHGQFYQFDYCIPFEFWSAIRLKCDAWVIIGYIKTGGKLKRPLDGVSVTAYDFDWGKDDVLGTAITDAEGYFRIDYSSREYTKTILSPLINIDTPISVMSGPDLYFKVTDKEGDLLYKETRETGDSKSRKNIHHCFYQEIVVEHQRITDEN